MTNGHGNRVPADNALQRALARASGTWGGYQAWRGLDSEKRFELVEQALGCTSNDLNDCFPLAL